MKRSQDADAYTIKIGKERLAEAAQLPAQPYSLSASKTIIFDTETTGLNPGEDEIIQISIIDGLGNVLINELVHPYWKKSWSEAARVNGITPDRVANAPYPHELIPKVKGIFAAADLLVAYNNQFDLNFLEEWGIQAIGKKQFDVMLAFAREYGEWNDFFCDYKWQKLGDMYPLYWTTSKEGIFMHYSYEFKLMCVELYHSGSYPDIPEGVNPDTLKSNIRQWARLVDLHGPEVLKPKVFNKVWTPEEKFELVSKVIAGIPKKKVAIEAGINPGMLYQWLHKYKLQGYNGLVESKKGRPTKEPRMKKSTNPLPLTESEREELIRLRAENEYIKAENEVIKKRIALRQEKWAAQLKAKKQQSSKNSEKRDTN